MLLTAANPHLTLLNRSLHVRRVHTLPVHLTLLCGSLLGKEVSYRESEAIRLVNDRLGDLNHGATDGTIGAVACFTIIKVSSNPVHLSLIHIFKSPDNRL